MLGEVLLDLESSISNPALFIDKVQLTDEGLKTQARLVGAYILEQSVQKGAVARHSGRGRGEQREGTAAGVPALEREALVAKAPAEPCSGGGLPGR